MLLRTKHMFFLLFLLAIAQASVAQFTFRPALTVGTSLVLGAQDNLLRFTVNVAGVAQQGNIAAEFSGGADFDFYLSKYTVKKPDKALRLEGYVLVGNTTKRTGKPFYAGELAATTPAEADQFDQIVYGGGLGLNQNVLFGSLKPLGNRQGLVLARAKVADRPLLVRVRNDFKSAFMRGSGTDQGETGFFHISYSFQDEFDQVHFVGLNLMLFTPVPDYAQNPTEERNSKDFSRPVLKTMGAHGKLFLGNFWGQYGIQSDGFSQTFGLGINSQKLGGKLQNALHDSFGLYPRFPWDTEAKNKLYFQSQSTASHAF